MADVAGRAERIDRQFKFGTFCISSTKRQYLQTISAMLLSQVSSLLRLLRRRSFVVYMPGVSLGYFLKSRDICFLAFVGWCVPADNPCGVVREIGECDKMYYYKERKITEEDLEEERKLRRAIGVCRER